MLMMTQAAAQNEGRNQLLILQGANPEQATFGAEIEIDHPVPIPNGVLQVLRKDKRNQQLLKQDPHRIAASSFVASKIHLNDDGRPDLIVGASDVRLLGANLAPFWVFVDTGRGHRLVLRTHTLVLDILKSRTEGHRNIRAIETTAVEATGTIFTFRNGKYHALSSRIQRGG